MSGRPADASPASDELLLVTGQDVIDLLEGRDAMLLQVVADAYRTHARGQTMMPADGYLRFPGRERERIISKVAYLGGDIQSAGVKWVASFPDNVAHGMERASATLILNSVDTGRPIAVLESSVISARRTGASAALAASHLWGGDVLESVGLIGCGPINFECLRFLLAVHPEIRSLHLYDLSAEHAQQFGRRARTLSAELDIVVERRPEDLLTALPVVCLATTAITPHILGLDDHVEGALFLHVSLRDFAPEVMLRADNVVDDIDKAVSNATSLHLAEQQVGSREFVRTTIGDVLEGNASPRDQTKPLTIFSPFGLGILDMAVARHVADRALEEGRGTRIEGFLPPSWLDR